MYLRSTCCNPFGLNAFLCLQIQFDVKPLGTTHFQAKAHQQIEILSFLFNLIWPEDQWFATVAVLS